MSIEEREVEEARERSEESAAPEEVTGGFEEGFTIKTVIGALFIAFIMLPGALYLGLVAGQGLGAAAQWVTIVLFAEIAKRSFVTLKKQEIFILYYVAGSLVVMTMAERGLSGGPFGSLIWQQYFVQSPQAAPFADKIPHWVVPPPGSHALIARTFLDAGWAVPIMLLVAGEILSRLNWISLGYVLFRITSDTERLPFPMAPVAAAGATALAEAQTKEESWRWQVFSVGTMVGLVFGIVYLAVPIISGMILAKPLMLIPIPFIDLTSNTESILPAALTGISGDLGNVLIGFVLPFHIVAGLVTSSVFSGIVMNPILQKAGLLPTWRHGMGTIDTQISTNLDFWMSIGIGVNVAVAAIGIYMVASTLVKARKNRGMQRAGSLAPPKGRGDFPLKAAIAVWLFATLISIAISHKLVGGFPLWILVGFGLVYSPLLSYVNARMYGMTGLGVGLPYVREATILQSGYKNVDIWFAPMPLYDMGWAAQRFREVELTKTKFTSILKAEAFMLPIILVASFGFWAFFWKSNPIPSPQFPYAQKFWPLQATMQSLWVSSNMQGQESWLLKALKPNLMFTGGITALVMYGVLALFKVPVLFFYGLAGGVGSLPHTAIPMFAGSLLSRHYFARRFGKGKWNMYTPVLLAGFSCGMGLIGMLAIALALIAKSINYLPY